MIASVRDLVAAARARLERANIDATEATMDATLLVRHLLGWDLARFVAHGREAPPPGFPAAFDHLVARRAGREPISVILGRREFWGLEFEVTPAVLAPRPETEIIVETALELGRTGVPPVGSAPLIIDVGTGSGCLAVSLAREFPAARVVAADISQAALQVALRNAARHGVSARVSLVRTSLLDGLSGPASLVVSNLPYVPSNEIPALPPEVRRWEPLGALDGGPDGLDLVRQLLADAPRVLASGGWLIMEFGFGQEQGVREAVSMSALELVSIRADLQGVPRTLVARITAA